MNKTSVKIGNKTFIVDLDKAISLGICEEEKFTNIKAGDVFSNDYGPILIGECLSDDTLPHRFQIFGYDGSLSAYADIHDGELASIEELRSFLCDGDYEFVRNINAQICMLMEDAKNSVRKSSKR
jgi:hypothetical protein